MRRLLALILAVGGAAAAAVIVRGAQPTDSPYLVELDAVVIDESGRAVTGLRQEDFQVREDGRPVELKTFDAVVDTGDGGRPFARSIVLLLDDSGIGAGNTLTIQSIARIVRLEDGSSGRVQRGPAEQPTRRGVRGSP